jgi:hypothetical protein
MMTFSRVRIVTRLHQERQANRNDVAWGADQWQSTCLACTWVQSPAPKKEKGRKKEGRKEKGRKGGKEEGREKGKE